MSKKNSMFRVHSRAKQGAFGWDREQQERHNKHLKASRRKARDAKQMRRGGLD